MIITSLLDTDLVGSTLTGPGADNPVAVYVDGVYQSAASALLFEFDNVDQIEVLRGPQGTLFGRNATGGAVRVTTQMPDFDPRLRTTLSYGRFNDFPARVFGNTPITETLAANIAVMYREADSYIDNLYPGNEVHGPSIFAVNPRLRWEPRNRLSVTLTGLYADHRDDRYESFAPYLRPSPAYVANPSFELPGPYEMNTDIPGVHSFRHDHVGQEQIDLRYTYDINGLLEVEATVVRTGSVRRVVIEENPGVLSAEEVEARLRDLSRLRSTALSAGRGWVAARFSDGSLSTAIRSGGLGTSTGDFSRDIKGPVML